MASVFLSKNMDDNAEFDPNVALFALDQTAAAIVFVNAFKEIVFFNPAAEHAFGLTRADVLGQKLKVLFPNDYHLAHEDYLDKYLDGAESLSTGVARDIEISRRDGSSFWSNVAISKVHYQNHVYFTLLLRDVSKRKKLEDDLISKNAQLAKLNAQMEKFLYSTSHDLRSPLTSIMGLVNLMRMESLDDSLMEYVTKIETSTMKLDGIIRNIMNFSKATYKRKRSEKIDPEQLSHRILNAYQYDRRFKNIHFEVVANQPFPFFSDPERIEIILNNIISNTINFYDANKVRSFVRINIVVGSEDLLLEIIDNGVGIGKQHHDQIFTMFYKATLNSSGAGLGLYIVKESLEQLKGTISMESELGFGSVFRIRIPNDQKGQLISRKLRLQAK